jgi:hypothetical protein
MAAMAPGVLNEPERCSLTAVLAASGASPND